MENIDQELQDIIGKPENEKLEYKAILPPSIVVAQIISSFANTDGGYLVLGVVEKHNKIEIKGLSEDFRATAITHKAIDLLSPKPLVTFQYYPYADKNLFVIDVKKSQVPISLERKIYSRSGTQIILSNPQNITFIPSGYAKIEAFISNLSALRSNSTNSKSKLLDHYQSVLKILDDLSLTLYPVSPEISTTIPEGKILARILFSSSVDNFESYLSDILFEIYLAMPETLKSPQTVTIEEVLNCADIQDFVSYCAKQKILKLQKGSVRGFIKENKQISDLRVLSDDTQARIEGILQIRHLYSHRNGIVDEKFLQFFSGFSINDEHSMSVSEICEMINYLAGIVNMVDVSAIRKYSLATV